MAWNPLGIYQEDKFLKLLPILLKTRLFEELTNGEVQGFKVGSRFDDTLNYDDIIIRDMGYIGSSFSQFLKE